MWSRSRSPTRFGSTRCPSCWLNSNPPLPGESAWIQCAYHLETRAFGYVKDSKGNMFVFPSGLTASERSIRNTADGVPCPCREEHLVGVFLVETGSIVADQTFLPLERSIRDRGRARRSLMKHVFGVLAEDIPTCRTRCTETLCPSFVPTSSGTYMNSLRQVQPHGSSSSSSRRPTPSRPSKPAEILVAFACALWSKGTIRGYFINNVAFVSIIFKSNSIKFSQATLRSPRSLRSKRAP